MRAPLQIENIDEMRRREGIDDVALRDEIRGLKVGDFVKLTLLSGPASAALSDLRAGAALAFTAAHIHSLLKRRPGP